MPVSVEAAREKGTALGFEGEDLDEFVAHLAGAAPAPKPAAPKPPPPMKMTAPAKPAAPVVPKVEAKPVVAPAPPAPAAPPVQGPAYGPEYVAPAPKAAAVPPPMYGPVAPPPYRQPQLTEASGPGTLPTPWQRGWSRDELAEYEDLRAKNPSIRTPKEVARAKRSEEYARQDAEAAKIPSIPTELARDYVVGARAAVDQFKRPERSYPGHRPPLAPGAELLHRVRGVEPSAATARVTPDATATPVTPRPVHNPRPAPGYKSTPVPRPASAPTPAAAGPSIDDMIEALILDGRVESSVRKLPPDVLVKAYAGLRQKQAGAQ